MNDWQIVDACPLCKRTANAMKRFTMPGKAIGSIDSHGLTVPISFAITYVQCAYCGMMYQNPRLTDAARSRFYTDGLYKELTATKNNYQTEILRAERLLHMIEPLDATSIMDIGCGHGELLKACQDATMLAHGVDINPSLAMDGIIVFPKPRSETYDIVSMVHYLEHTVDPLAEIKTAMKYSRRYVLVEVPLVDPTDTTKAYLNLPHTLIFEPPTLVMAMERAGLTIADMQLGQNWVVAIGEKGTDDVQET